MPVSTPKWKKPKKSNNSITDSIPKRRGRSQGKSTEDEDDDEIPQNNILDSHNNSIIDDLKVKTLETVS